MFYQILKPCMWFAETQIVSYEALNKYFTHEAISYMVRNKHIVARLDFQEDYIEITDYEV